MPVWSQGIGESSGDALVTESPLVTSGQVYFVDSVTGSDLYTGKDRVRPFSTIAHAVSLMVDGDIAVLLPTHQEVVGSTVNITQNCVTFCGSGTAGGQPTAQLTPRDIGADMLNVTGAKVSFRNIKFAAQHDSDTHAKIKVAGAGCEISGCRFEQNQNDTGAAVVIATGGDYGRISACTFVATNTTRIDDGPLLAVQVAAAATANGWDVVDTIFDSGVSGYLQYWVFDANSATVFSRFRFERIACLRGADVRLKSTGIGLVNIITAQGGSRLDWM